MDLDKLNEKKKELDKEIIDVLQKYALIFNEINICAKTTRSQAPNGDEDAPEQHIRITIEI